MYPDSMRASDADRQRVVDALQEQAGQGRLTLAEFDERSASAYDATTLGDLRALTKDLPVGNMPLGASPEHSVQGAGLGWQQSPGGLPAPTNRARHVATTVAVVLVVLFVASATISVFTSHFFFPLPFILLAFVFLRMGGGGRHHGPGYHHQ